MPPHAALREQVTPHHRHGSRPSQLVSVVAYTISGPTPLDFPSGKLDPILHRGCGWAHDNTPNKQDREEENHEANSYGRLNRGGMRPRGRQRAGTGGVNDDAE